MKSRLILTGIAAVLLTAPLGAQAADLAQPAYKAPAYIAPLAANWTGLYLGINGGYGFGSSDWDSPAVSPGAEGGVAGGTVGYNFQAGSWVWGLEGDVDWSGISGDATCGAGGTCTTSADWIGTARLRLGFAGWGNVLAYVTGGATFAGVKAENTNLATSASNAQVGWTAGAGLEYAFGAQWSAKVEYLYADLGSFDCSTACSLTVAPDDVSFTTSLVRAGLNYRF
ncbi:MAG: porin family protein [Pseudolabrys sp.]